VFCRGAKGVTKCWHAGELSAYTSYVDKDIGVYSRCLSILSA
jgi:hypothetical protein